MSTAFDSIKRGLQEAIEHAEGRAAEPPTMPVKQPAPLGRYRNPFDFLKDADRQEQKKRADLERTGRLTDETAREIAEACGSQRTLAEANHRELVRRLAWNLTPAGSRTPDEMGGAFLAKKGGGVSLLACVSLIVAEVTAKDFPADLPFWMVPDDKEFAAAIGRTHREALQIVKDAIRTNALPVRRAQGIPRHCNQEADVIAWCDDTAAARPAAKLCGAREDMRGVFAVLGLQPPPELFANQDEWLAATESAQVEAARRSAMTQTVIERLVELRPPPASSGSNEVWTGLEDPAGEQTSCDANDSGAAHAPKPNQRKSRSDLLADVLDEAWKATSDHEVRPLWRWIITNIKQWPEITYDSSSKQLRVGKNDIDFEAFRARVTRKRKKTDA